MRAFRIQFEPGKSYRLRILSSLPWERRGASFVCSTPEFREPIMVAQHPSRDTELSLPPFESHRAGACILSVPNDAAARLPHATIIAIHRWYLVLRFTLFLASVAAIAFEVRRHWPSLIRGVLSIPDVLQRGVPTPLLIATLGVMGLLALRVLRAGGNGHVFGDETAYSLIAFAGECPNVLLKRFGNGGLPNLLYFSIYGLLRGLSEDDFVIAGRLLNCAVYALCGGVSLFHIYRRWMGGASAQAVAAVAVAGPASLYTAFYMPESLFLAVFWAAFALILRVAESRSAGLATVAGIAWGAVLLVKPHGATPLIVCAIGIAVDVGMWKTNWLRVRQVCVVCAAAGATVAFLGMLLATSDGGWASLGLYGPIVRGTVQAKAETWAPFWKLGGAHTLLVGSVYGFPLYVACTYLLRRVRGQVAEDDKRKLRCIAISAAMLLVLVLTTTRFTVALAEQGATNRLHSRYYSHVLPLILGFAALSAADQTRRAGVRALAFAGGVCLVACGLLAPMEVFGSYVDTPEFGLLIRERGAGFRVAAVTTGVLIAGEAFLPLTTRWMYFGLFGLYALMVNVSLGKEAVVGMRPRLQQEVIAIRELLRVGGGGSSGVVVADDWDVGTWAALFRLQRNVDVVRRSEWDAWWASREAEERSWAVVLGKERRISQGRVVFTGSETTLVQWSPEDRRDLEAPHGPQDASVKGLRKRRSPLRYCVKQEPGAGVVVRASGWAVDQSAGLPAGGVWLVVGEEAFVAVGGLPRPDVARALGRGAYTNSGFTVTIGSKAIVGRGAAPVLRILSANLKSYFDAPLVPTPLGVDACQ